MGPPGPRRGREVVRVRLLIDDASRGSLFICQLCDYRAAVRAEVGSFGSEEARAEFVRREVERLAREHFMKEHNADA